MTPDYRVTPLTLATHILLLLAFCLVGCSTSLAPAVVGLPNVLTGNWQVSSKSSTAAKLPVLSGALTGSPASVTGILHAASAGACITPTTAIAVTGHADEKNVLTLSGALAGGTLVVSGNVADDGKSLTGATYSVAGGSCAFGAATANAQSYSSVTGTYVGSFSDEDGQTISITADLTQTPTSDTTGNFQLSGTGTFPNNPCFSSPVSVSNAQVTGGNFTLTYADQTTQNSVTASGTFSTDANTLTVTSWTMSGSCGPDSGTGLLSRQP